MFNAANEMTRYGGFCSSTMGTFTSSTQVLPPWVTKVNVSMCALQAHADGPTTFGVQSCYRVGAREALVRWECGERVRRAALRKAAHVVGSYQVGDIVSYCREARAGEHGILIDRLRGGQKHDRMCCH